MEIQYYGANCLSISVKSTRIVIDDNLIEMGKKSIIKNSDVALYSYFNPKETIARLTFNGPGEYEVGEVSITGFKAKAFMNDDNPDNFTTIYKISSSELSIVVCGNILGELDDSVKEFIHNTDILFIPVGNNGLTLDPIGALKIIKEIEPSVVVPVHYKSKTTKYPVEQIDLEQVIKDFAMEPKNTVSKLKLKRADLTDITQLYILEEQN